MNNQFTNEELNSISKNLTDCTFNVYYREICPTAFCITTGVLPKGNYHIEFADEMDTTRVYNRLSSWKNLRVILENSNTLCVELLEETFFHFTVENNAMDIVISLRKQLLLMARDKNRLIKKCIEEFENLPRTNLGEDYNRNSFYDTIDECVDFSIPMQVDETKSPKDADVKYLQMIKLMQDKAELKKQQAKLNARKEELRQKELDLLRY